MGSSHKKVLHTLQACLTRMDVHSMLRRLENEDEELLGKIEFEEMEEKLELKEEEEASILRRRRIMVAVVAVLIIPDQETQ